MTGKKGAGVTVTSTMYIEYMRANPDRNFLTLDLAQHFHVSLQAVRQAMSRICKPGGGPVRRVAKGIFIYDPTKEGPDLKAVLRPGNWRFENLVLVTKGIRSMVQSQADRTLDPEEPPQCDTQNFNILTHSPECIPDPDHPGMDLPTGQQVRWWIYPTTGTRMICISSKGAPPLSPDYLIGILADLEKQGMNPVEWDISCVEYLVDSEKIRFEGTFTYQAFEGELFKGYNHGYYGRFEWAVRHRISPTEFIQTCRILVEGTLNTRAIKEIKSLKNKVDEIGKTSRLALNIATKERDSRPTAKSALKINKPPVQSSSFKTGLEIKREAVKASVSGSERLN